MGTSIRMLFYWDGDKPQAWEWFVTQVAEGNEVLDEEENYIDLNVQGGYGYCEDYPNVEDVPKLKGIKWSKWYNEHDPDEEGEIQ